jgi:phosphoserine phosphatase
MRHRRRLGEENSRKTALPSLLATLLLGACGHTSSVVTIPELQRMVREEPIPPGHVACAVFDADGTLWDFDLSETLVEQTIRARTASELGLPAFNALLQDFGLAAAADIYQANAALEGAWSSGQLHAIGRQRGWDEEAVNVRIWPHYNWLYVGSTPEALGERARQLMGAQGYRAKVFAGMRSLLDALRAEKFQLRVVSGGVHEFVAEAAADLGFAPGEVRGLRVQLRDGLLTAEVDAPVPYKQGKATLTTELCGGKPMFAFGDSVASGDSALLALAAHPVAVRPKGRHLAAALQLAMPILERPEASD